MFSFFRSVRVFSLVVWGSRTLPDEFFVVDSTAINISGMYSLEPVANDAAKTVADVGSTRNYETTVSFLKVIPIKDASVTVSQRRYAVAGGDVFGLRLYKDGVVVVGMDDVNTAGGTKNPAKAAGLQIGDVITAMNDKKVTRNTEVSAHVQSSGGAPVTLSVKRAGKNLTLTFVPVLSDTDGRYKAGLWVRDSSAGIGTMTFYNNETGIFGGLGHAICDVDTGETMPLMSGDILEAQIRGCYKGTSGYTGELCGNFKDKITGTLLYNETTGVYGVLNEIPRGTTAIPVATKQEIKAGAAQIISTVDDGGPKYYDIEITKVNTDSDSEKKNMVIKVTDADLIAKTGGIVQGMSGSPIIQNGMLVGAVTHVFVNDPTQGYAIFAQIMLDTAAALEIPDAREPAA